MKGVETVVVRQSDVSHVIQKESQNIITLFGDCIMKRSIAFVVLEVFFKKLVNSRVHTVFVHVSVFMSVHLLICISVYLCVHVSK